MPGKATQKTDMQVFFTLGRDMQPGINQKYTEVLFTFVYFLDFMFLYV